MYSKIFRTEKIKGWGGYPSISCNVFRPERISDLVELITREKGTILARGGGTSYGDASINKDGINIDVKRLNKFIRFDSNNGILRCQSGITLKDIIKVFLPKGWFLNVTPGTQLATVGGCVACNAHGKNWKAGSFCNFVNGLTLMLHDGSIIYCDHNENSDIFNATFGGMGMTGVILDVDFQLKKVNSPYIDLETIRFRNLKELFDLYTETDTDEYLFSWIDSLKEGENIGRGILQRANHSTHGDLLYKEKVRFPVPFYMPHFTVNRYTTTVFNGAYYLAARNTRRKKQVYITDFFYPLDSITHWYKIYGKQGFVEYQAVVPYEGAYEAIFELLKTISKSKLSSVVASVKPLIKSDGLLSFPIDGFTLAVDFGYNEKLWPLLDKLDEMVIECGGRVYLAKDAHLNSKSFKEMYSDSFEMWESVREKYHLKDNFSSLMFNRFIKT